MSPRSRRPSGSPGSIRSPGARAAPGLTRPRLDSVATTSTWAALRNMLGYVKCRFARSRHCYITCHIAQSAVAQRIARRNEGRAKTPAARRVANSPPSMLAIARAAHKGSGYAQRSPSRTGYSYATHGLRRRPAPLASFVPNPLARRGCASALGTHSAASPRRLLRPATLRLRRPAWLGDTAWSVQHGRASLPHVTGTSPVAVSQPP